MANEGEILYLDYNATTPLLPEVKEAITASMELYGNPSSTHSLGKAAKEQYETARAAIAGLIGAGSQDILLVSCGTESINYCLKGAALAARAKGGGKHIITSSVEHVAVLETCRYLESQHDFDVTFVEVDSTGPVTPAAVSAALRDDTVIVSIMHSNNEVGTINPIADISALVKARGALMHTDASQSCGKVPVDVEELGVDYLTIAGHKLYAPKGVGALYIRPGTPPLRKFMHGAGHESGLRAGTENTLLVCGLGAACDIAAKKLAQTTTHLALVRDKLQANLEARFDTSQMRVNGHLQHRLPNTLSVSFKDAVAPIVLASIQHRVAASAGSACHASEPGAPVHVSHVLSAMSVPQDFAMGTLRLSVGRDTTLAEADEAAQIIGDAVDAFFDQRQAKKPKLA